MLEGRDRDGCDSIGKNQAPYNHLGVNRHLGGLDLVGEKDAFPIRGHSFKIEGTSHGRRGFTELGVVSDVDEADGVAAGDDNFSLVVPWQRQQVADTFVRHGAQPKMELGTPVKEETCLIS